VSRRLLVGIAALLALEVGYFGYSNRDLVWLSRSTDTLVADAAFVDHAATALTRRRISRKMLERIAEAARRRSDFDLQLTALTRIAQRSPDDPNIQLRRADLLRSLGRSAEAEELYRAQLAVTTQPVNR
jgi:Flp pilus assembly protein TadD